MFSKIFKKKNEEKDSNSILIAALLIHAAKIDQNYTEFEKTIIKNALIKLELVKLNDANKLLIEAEKKEQDSNQILEFTKQIKKNPIEFRLKIIEILWKIVYSDGTSDNYESNLIRRICGLLYIPDRESGEIKSKVRDTIK